MDANNISEQLFIDNWTDNFNEEVKNIQLEYDSFFSDRKIQEYYSLEHTKDNMLSLHFHDVHGLPRMIMSAIEQAFLRSKPRKM
jgi:hypothetical protein